MSLMLQLQPALYASKHMLQNEEKKLYIKKDIVSNN